MTSLPFPSWQRWHHQDTLPLQLGGQFGSFSLLIPSWRRTLAAHTSQPPSLPPPLPHHPSCGSQHPAGGTQNKHPPTCSRGPAREMAEAIITHSAQRNYPARGRRGRKQLEIIHRERCSHPQCLGVCLTPSQPGLYRECAPWALSEHPECRS